MGVEFKEKVSLEPLGSRMIIQLLEEQHGSIIVPESAKTKPPYGVVVACGEECTKRLLVFGKKVLFAPGSGLQVRTGSEVYVVVDESDILSVVSEVTEVSN